MITCKKATWLLSVREDRTLSQKERFQLSLHIRCCGPCERFQWQTSLITRALGNTAGQPAALLDDYQKNRLRILLSKLK
jgi:hypothetical protein